MVIIAIAAIIRLWNFPYDFVYNSEVAQHYLEIIKLNYGQLFLSGPATSHSWLTLNPIIYYFFYPIFAFFRYHPLTLGYVNLGVSIILVPVNYFVIKKIFNKRTASISTVLLAFSPLHISFGQLPGFFNFIPVLLYLLILSIKLPWLTFSLIGILTSLHASVIILIPLFAVWFFVSKKLNRRMIFLSLIGFTSVNLPFLINDSGRQFFMLRSLALWIPYKILNFLTGNTIGLGRATVTDTTITDISNFMSKSFLAPVFPVITGGIIFFIILLYFIAKRPNGIERLIFVWFFWGLLTLIIHKNPPVHYFTPIFTLPVILISRIFDQLSVKTKSNIIMNFIIIIIIAVNTAHIISSRSAISKAKFDPVNIRYSTQEKIARFIINNAGGNKFTIERVGIFDNYIEQFAQNYKYLLWWMDNSPTSKASIHYVINENLARPVKIRGLKKLTTFDNIEISVY